MGSVRIAFHNARRVAAVALGMSLVAALASPVAAAPQRIPFSGVFYPCGGTAGEEFVGGNVLHFRNAENHNLWSTANPLVDGPEVNVVNGDINLKTGTGVAHPRTTVYPVAVDGTWEIPVKIDDAGTYQVICAIPSHFGAGMEGSLTVE